MVGVVSGVSGAAPQDGKMPWLAVGICVAINMLDGFDVLAIAFTAPTLAKVWSVAPAALGLLLSASLAGMTLGALLLSPIADLYGRRVILLCCLLVISAGMLGSATTNSVTELALMRVITGLGIGGLLAGTNTAVAEYAPARQRDMAIAMVTAGYPVGAVLGGIISIDLIAHFSWRAVYVFGGATSLLLVPVVFFALPESLSFLYDKRPANALERANKALRQLNRAPITELPPVSVQDTKRSLFDVFGPQLRTGTIAICSAFFFMMFTLYFVLSWLPKNVTDLGLSPSSGIMISTIMNLAGIVGGLTLGAIARIIGLREIAGLFMVLCFVTMAVFGQLPVDYTLLIGTAAVLGFFIFGAFVSLYAIVAELFPTHVRATGTGLALGIGRIGATLGPIVAGFLIAGGWTRPAYYTLMAVPCLIGAYFGMKAARGIRRGSKPL